MQAPLPYGTYDLNSGTLSGITLLLAEQIVDVGTILYTALTSRKTDYIQGE